MNKAPTPTSAANRLPGLAHRCFMSRTRRSAMPCAMRKRLAELSGAQKPIRREPCAPGSRHRRFSRKRAAGKPISRGKSPYAVSRAIFESHPATQPSQPAMKAFSVGKSPYAVSRAIREPHPAHPGRGNPAGEPLTPRERAPRTRAIDPRPRRRRVRFFVASPPPNRVPAQSRREKESAWTRPCTIR